MSIVQIIGFVSSNHSMNDKSTMIVPQYYICRIGVLLYLLLCILEERTHPKQCHFFLWPVC